MAEDFWAMARRRDRDLGIFPGREERPMLVTASPGTGRAGLCASRLDALKELRPMDANPHRYLNGYGI